MAFPVTDNYSAAVSPVRGGRFGVINDVVAGVWTPTKDGAGNILDASWAGLPLDTWVAVGGSSVRQLQNVLDANGFAANAVPLKTFGTNKTVVTTFTAWVGMALDEAGGRAIIPWGGGHADSSLNGIWALALEKMGAGTGWDVLKLPTDPYLSGYEWSDYYKNNTGGTFTQYNPEAFPSERAGVNQDILPNGEATSRHTYNGVWYDSLRNQVGQSRGRKWVFDLGTGVSQRNAWTNASAVTYNSINNNLFYDPLKDEIFGHFTFTDSDASRWGYVPAGGVDIVSIGSPLPMMGGHSSVKISDSEVLLLSQTTNTLEKWGVYNCSTRTWTSGDVGGTPATTDTYTNEMQVLCYVPQWGKAIRRLTWSPATGQWELFNAASKGREAYTPAGNPPPFSSWPGNKCFYYPRRKCVVYITTTGLDAEAVYVMRTGN